MTRAFVDTNALLYSFSADPSRTERVRGLLREGGVVSVQVLNEYASVVRRKFGGSWEVVHAALGDIRDAFEVTSVTAQTHELGLKIAERYGFRIYDSLLLAAALLVDCDTFWSEDMQDGQVVDGRLTIRNPFA